MRGALFGKPVLFSAGMKKGRPSSSRRPSWQPSAQWLLPPALCWSLQFAKGCPPRLFRAPCARREALGDEGAAVASRSYNVAVTQLVRRVHICCMATIDLSDEEQQR